uniref:Uncharacterized protein n=1 Tax=Cacopsylla melanoneura TaxID=428564 RepID=A0A8D9EWU3_9HEMI
METIEAPLLVNIQIKHKELRSMVVKRESYFISHTLVYGLQNNLYCQIIYLASTTHVCSLKQPFQMRVILPEVYPYSQLRVILPEGYPYSQLRVISPASTTASYVHSSNILN